MLKYLLLGAAVLGLTSAANAECIPNATLRERNPNTASFIYETKRGEFAISVYRKGESFEEFVEVKRVGRCIEAIEPITADQFVSRYLEYPEAWIAEQEGADNEGMPVEGDEFVEQPLSEEQQFPFLSLEERAVPSNLMYKGSVGRPDFKGRDKDFANYRTRILKGMSQGVNFSGGYRITQIGCGSSCSFAILSDLRTGKQFNFPRGGEEVGPLSLKFSANSSLIISTWRSGDECVLESLQFDGKNWVTLAKPSLGEADLCYESIDDNIAAYKSRNGLSASGMGHASKRDGTQDAAIASGVSKRGQPTVSSTPKPEDAYEDINVTALTDLYEARLFLQACFEARRDLFPVYVTASEMEKAETSFKRSEAEILARNGLIDKGAVQSAAEARSKYHTSILVASSRIEVNYEIRNACRLVVSSFPPDIAKTLPRKKPSIENEVNSGGGLIIPKDPRFN